MDHQAMLDSINKSTDAAVDTKNGLLAAPGALANYGKTLVEGGNSAIYSAGRSVLKNFAETLTAMRLADDAVRQPHKDSRQELGDAGATRWSVNPALQAEFTTSLGLAFDRAGAALDKHRNVIAAGVDALQTEVQSKLRDPAENSVSRATQGSEVRALIRALAPAARMQAVATLISESDLPSVAAIWGAPKICSGMDAKQLAILHDQAERQFAGPIAARRDAARKVLDHVDAASNDFVRRFKKFQPRPATRAAATTVLQQLRGAA